MIQINTVLVVGYLPRYRQLSMEPEYKNVFTPEHVTRVVIGPDL